MKNRPTLKPVVSLLYGLSASFTAFWIFTLIKAVSKPFKKALVLYEPVGPLSGLYVFSVLVGGAVFLLALALMRKTTPRREKLSFILYFLSIIVFALMVFPPVFETIAEIFE